MSLKNSTPRALAKGALRVVYYFAAALAVAGAVGECVAFGTGHALLGFRAVLFIWALLIIAGVAALARSEL